MIIAALPLLGAWALAVISPGPDFVITLKTAASHTRRDGLWVAVGVVSGITCWALLALLGLSALLDHYQHLYQAVRIAGASFLILYGATTVWHAWRQQPLTAPSTNIASSAQRAATPMRHWRIGLLTNLANPKAMVFFGALFASLLPAHATVPERLIVLAIMLFMALAWFSGVALAAATPLITGAYRRSRRTLDTITGGIFVGIGTALMPR